ncbi:translation initiation factor IF-2 [Listeria fleischmannii FSL S10-1203]|uniref:Translation initiation factor IF-2 n=1 Tax=Listeria fleischmannii FSL S10-1203 TaxID=1265822 RepID=W7DVK8_9LIST|nr:translation initiation factor IF-2 [Listeria fleischmannii FSL S10-1203]
MSKIRVYEYAKKQQISSKEVIEKLRVLGVEVANHMSTINENALRQLDESFSKKNQPVKENKRNEAQCRNK